ncbi:hypothetical protein FHN55_09455 [Streptomyces sp. NP160]|uniref:hypothetical protein n=1 Tax=Streptomyces sp. NP160 TaxID=2586637 RepID=UPI00111AD1C3|nr:hypothetical protein [Streptomyces sp. NP160]TNM67654.1 hypothetical protein FHN55_09455 [Streptomyces sp. NP160]
MTRSTTALAVGAGALAVALLASACTGGTGSGGGSSSSSATGGATTTSPAPTTGLVRADATDAAPPPRPTPREGLGRLEDQPYGCGTSAPPCEVWLPVVATGPAELVNSRLRASADYGVRVASASDGPHAVSGRSEVTVNDGRTLQVLIELYDEPSVDAEPVESVTTVALTADDASPVFLADQLADPDAAWAVLVQEATDAGAEDGLVAERPLEASAEQFADWQAGTSGVEVWFQRGEFGPGVTSVVLPWEAVLPLMTPGGRALLAP